MILRRNCRATASAGESPPYISLLNLVDEIRPEIVLENPIDIGPVTTIPFDGVWLPPLYSTPLPDAAPAVQSISERARKRILEWSESYGLLGIFHQRVLFFQTAPSERTKRYLRGDIARAGGQFVAVLEGTRKPEDPICVYFPKALAHLAVVSPAAQVLADFGLKASFRQWFFEDDGVQAEMVKRY
jgi:hypothetical protein